jgi:hypothetical protein
MDRAVHKQILDEVRRDIADLESRISELRAVEKYHATKAGVPESAPSRVVIQGQFGMGKSAGVAELFHNATDALADPPEITAGEFAKMTMRDAATVILTRVKGYCLNARQIANALIDGGYETTNPDGLRNAAFSMLTRESDVFEKVGSGFWRLKTPVAPEGTPPPDENHKEE